MTWIPDEGLVTERFPPIQPPLVSAGWIQPQSSLYYVSGLRALWLLCQTGPNWIHAGSRLPGSFGSPDPARCRLDSLERNGLASPIRLRTNRRIARIRSNRKHAGNQTIRRERIRTIPRIRLQRRSRSIRVTGNRITANPLKRSSKPCEANTHGQQGIGEPNRLAR